MTYARIINGTQDAADARVLAALANQGLAPITPRGQVAAADPHA
jgi:hypothetical protein